MQNVILCAGGGQIELCGRAHLSRSCVKERTPRQSWEGRRSTGAMLMNDKGVKPQAPWALGHDTALRPSWPAQRRAPAHWLGKEESQVRQKWPGPSTPTTLSRWPQLCQESVSLPQTLHQTPKLLHLEAVTCLYSLWSCGECWESCFHGCPRTWSLNGELKFSS